MTGFESKADQVGSKGQTGTNPENLQWYLPTLGVVSQAGQEGGDRLGPVGQARVKLDEV